MRSQWRVPFNFSGTSRLNQDSHAAALRLADDTIAPLRATFATFNHSPSDAQWEALKAIVEILGGMATGSCPPFPHLSALDPGVGKTQAVVHFLRTLLASPDHRDVGVLICIQRLEQITSMVADAGLNEDDFAVFTSDPTMNALGRSCGQRHKARALFTTHAMLERRIAREHSFEAVSDFYFRDRVRAVRVWDEALVPGKPLTVSRWDISHLFRYLKSDYSSLVADLEELAGHLRTEPNGNRVEIPDLAARHAVSIDHIRPLLRGPDAEIIAEALWHLFGRVVTVRQDAGVEVDETGSMRRGNTILDYHNNIPKDLWPVLILDASGRVRTTYKLWEERRMGLIRLPEGPKRYDGHTVHLWSTAGSKTAWKKNGRLLVDGIADTIRQRLDEEWLLIVHKETSIRGFDVAEEVRNALPLDARVSFTTWGKHDATNEFANIPNVILGGTLFLPRSFSEALGRCAAGFPSSRGSFAQADINEVEIGEHHHRILQAVCRGKVRKCEGDRCPSHTHTYIIAAPRSQIGKTIDKVLPGATMVPWLPGARKESKGRKAEILNAIVSSIGDRVAAIDVMKRVGWSTTRNGKGDFKTLIRDNADFQLALAEAGFEEVRAEQVWFERTTRPVAG
jgi:hypothetical protein